MRVTGTVRWFDLARGFGVIRRRPGEPDCFVRHSAMRGTVHHALSGGEAVEFDLSQGGAGSVAQDVIRLGSTPSRPPEGG